MAGRTTFGAAAALAFAGLCGVAAGDSALVVTEARSLSGEPAVSHVHRVDTNSGESLDAPIQAPGVIERRPVVDGRGHGLFAAARGRKQPGIPESFRPSRFLVVQAAPFRLLDMGSHMTVLGAPLFPVGTGTSRHWTADVAVVEGPQSRGGRSTVTTYPYELDTPKLNQTPLNSSRIEGTVVGGAAITQSEGVLVLTQGDAEEAPAAVFIRTNLRDAEPARTAMTPPDPYVALAGQGVTQVNTTNQCLVAATGYSVNQSPASRSTWLWLVETPDVRAVGPPLRIPGVPAPGDAMAIPAATGTPPAVWVPSHEPGTDFGYLTEIAVTEAGLSERTRLTVTGVSKPPLVVSRPDSEGILVGAESRLEVRDANGSIETTHTFDAPIAHLSAADGGVLIGEGNRLHRVDPATGARRMTAAFQAGHVRWVFPAKAMPRNAVPSEAIEAPRFSLPADVTFHGDAIITELRSVLVEYAGNDGYRWRVELPGTPEHSWLRAYPLGGETPGRFVMAVDPAAYGGGEVPAARVKVHVRNDRGEPVRGSPAAMDVRIAPPRSAMRKVLWVLAPSQLRGGLRTGGEPSPFRPFAELLAAPPLRMNHEVADEQVTRSLGAYTCVIVTTQAAALGRITRSALFEYLWDGGAVLVITSGGVDTGGPTLPPGWLDPSGIRMTGETISPGAIEPRDKMGTGIRTEGVSFVGGTALDVTGRSAAPIATQPGGGPAAAAVTQYGLGRLAVVGAAPFLGQSLYGTPNALFAQDLLRWLARSRHELEDQDGDGLRDDVEDPDGDGALDPGETHHLKADTDGDGLPDGWEDANRNGLTEPTETGGANVDTDNDGIWDGADQQPLPAMDAPAIRKVEPAEGPAEGGYPVRVSGAHFEPGVDVWLGGRKAEATRFEGPDQLMVRVPPFPNPEGGLVDVRVQSTTGVEARLPNGFRYGPPSLVRVTFDALRAVESQYNVYSGVLRLRVESKTPVRGGFFDVEVGQAESLEAARLDDAEPAGALSRLDVQLLSPTLIRVPFTAANGGLSTWSMGIAWDADFGKRPPRLRFDVRAGQVLPDRGAPIPVEGTPRIYQLRELTGQTAP